MDESKIRLIIFLIVIMTMIIWERLAPYRARKLSPVRTLNNLLLLLINTAILRLFAIAAPISAALYAQKEGFGLMHWLGFTETANIVITLFLFDALIYFQHRLMHLYKPLWQLHGLHHTDPELDFSSAGRFHTLEILLSFVIKTIFVLLLGVSFWGVLIFEAVLNGMATFNHANIKLPVKIEQFSTHRKETNSNFGFNFSVWDKLFGTYIAQAEKTDSGLEIGLKNSNKIPEQTTRLFWMLKAPFSFVYDDPD